MTPDPLAHAPLTDRGLRDLPMAVRWVAAALLVAMSLFHLYAGTFGEFSSTVQLPVHLAFAGVLGFMLFPLSKRWSSRWTLWLDVLLGAALACTALYITFNREALAARSGAANHLDLWVAGAGVLLILEVTRRTISPVLSVVTILFLLYALIGHWQMFGRTAGHAELSLGQVLDQQFYTGDGVFGTPLAVSATYVFLFVLFGAMLEQSGAAQYLIDLAFATMGRFRGGPAKAAVLASGFMGTLSGSSIANTVTTGTLTIPLMKKAGFRPHVAGAVEVAASTNGQLMPPVMGAAAFIMAEFTGIPYSKIIIAAALPAILSYTAIFVMIHLEARRHNIEAVAPEDRPPLWRTVLHGLHLNLPLISVVLFLMGMGKLMNPMTPMTSATWAIYVTLAVFCLVAFSLPRTMYGMGDLKGSGLAARAKHFGRHVLWALRDGAMNMIGIAVATACCGIIIGVVAQTGMAPKIGTMIETLSGGHLLPALLVTAVTCVAMGIGLPTTATYLIMSALVAGPLYAFAVEAGMPGGETLLLATHLFVFYYGIIADDTPPVGLCAYAAAGIAQSDPVKTGLTSFRFDLAAATLPLIFFYNPELLLMTDERWRLVWVIPAALVGMACFAAALQGFVFDRWRWWERIGLLGVSFLLVVPGWRETVGGLVLLGVLFGLHAVMRRGVEKRDATSPARQ